ncbi:MAG TPA: ATP-dependent DNA ligase [Nocardioidaceae bacterium]|nr:ATP-dependent DNA ligase [Nocardioidaceae bacterium]
MSGVPLRSIRGPTPATFARRKRDEATVPLDVGTARHNVAMLLDALVATSAQVASTRSRLAKRAALVELLRRATPDDVEIVVAYLSGEVRQRRTGIGWASLRALPAPTDEPELTLTDVDSVLQHISELSGQGSAGSRTAALASLFARATAVEQDFLRRLISSEIRQGALDSAMIDAVAVASSVPLTVLRRAVMLCGATGPVAVAALAGGSAAVEAFTLQVGRPVRPMLASTAPDITAALDKLGAGVPVSVDAKLDGIRIQAHKDGSHVRLYTRSLDDITDRLPEVVDVVRSSSADRLILDGEALALDPTGRPRPFQETAARTASESSNPVATDAVSCFFFDILSVDGEDLIDLPLRERLVRLDLAAPPGSRVARIVTADTDEARDFFEATVAAGQEGVVVKSLDAPYDAGRRGAAWVKVKPRQTLDLVVLAVEWGSGRRTGKLSNIHLGARDPDTGSLVMLGKTFKGMTDEMLAWQTERFLALETSRAGHVVHLRPEQVVEIAFDGVQRSTRYPGGMALRFARVLRYRDDKSAAEADTIETVRRVAAQG